MSSYGYFHENNSKKKFLLYHKGVTRHEDT